MSGGEHSSKVLQPSSSELKNRETTQTSSTKINSTEPNENIYVELRTICKTSNFDKRFSTQKDGYGIVYEAYDQDLKKKVSLKKIELQYENQSRKKKFVSKIVILKDLSHKNLVNFLDSYFVEKLYKELWVVFEFMDGGPLSDMIAVVEMTEEQIASVVKEVLSGLEFLHENGIIHRDIRSDVILLSRAGEVKIGLHFAFFASVEEDEKRTSMVG